MVLSTANTTPTTTTAAAVMLTPPLPRSHVAQLSLDTDYYRTMLDLHQRVATTSGGTSGSGSGKEVLLGWYTTGTDIDPTTLAIHEFFIKELGAAVPMVHVLVDASLSSIHSHSHSSSTTATTSTSNATTVSKLVQAFTASPVGGLPVESGVAGGPALGTVFHPLPCKFSLLDEEKSASMLSLLFVVLSLLGRVVNVVWLTPFHSTPLHSTPLPTSLPPSPASAPAQWTCCRPPSPVPMRSPCSRKWTTWRRASHASRKWCWP